MGKKKRGKRNNDSNSTVIPHPRATGHDEQCDAILNSMPDEAESAEQYYNIDEFNSPTTTTTTTLSIGDTVKINGLVDASEYNGMRGVIVSELDATTNRCGVRITSKNANVMAIQATNLTLEHRAKKSTRNVDRVEDSNGIWRHVAVALKFCVEEERLALVKQNISQIQICENAVASWTRYNESRVLPEVKLGPERVSWLVSKYANIINKWRDQASTGFVRFLNGKTTDCCEANLQFVSLRDALHFDEWTVDWGIYLTEEEINLVKGSGVGIFLTHPEQFLTNINNDAEDATDATNNQRGCSSLPPVIANEGEVSSAQAIPTTDFAHADSHNTKQVGRIMKDFLKCKKDAVKRVMSTLNAGNCDSFRHGLIVNGLVSVVLGFLSQCEHEDFNDVVNKVKGNLRTPVDWIEILLNLSTFERCKLEIANGIQAVIRCLCDDTKRLFFKSKKYWHQAGPPFLVLISNLLASYDSSNVTAANVSNILLKNEGFLENMIQKSFWSSYRPDILKEQHHFSSDIMLIEPFARSVIKNIIVFGLERNKTETDAELNRLKVSEAFSNGGLDLIMTVANTPVVSRAHDPECNVYFVVGMIGMLKSVNSDDSAVRRSYFDILILVFGTLRLTADYVDNNSIAEVVDLGRRFTANIDDAMSISKISYSMLVRKAQGQVYPIDKHSAFAIKSGLFEMCFELLARFACDPSVRLIACDSKRDELIECLVAIADIIKLVAFHQKTSKAIRDHWSQIVEALKQLCIKVKSKQSSEFVDIVSSIMELNEGSCSRCNKPIEWHTALFCGGCRRVSYCGVKCQKEDWRHGTHSNDCSFLACSADMMGLTMFDVKSSRSKSELKGLRNNMVTSQMKLFLKHEDALSRQLLTYSDRSDYIAVFDLSNSPRSISFVHYHDQFTCLKQRKWFEDFRSPDKVVCLFMSHVFNGELDEDGHINMIALFAAFPIPYRIHSGFTLYATVTMSEIKSIYPDSKSSEHFPNVINMFETLTKEDRAYWDKRAALELIDSSSGIPSHARAEALKGMGNDFFKIGDYKSAVEMYTFATTINPSAPTYWSNLAASYEKLGMYDEMQKASESCIYADQTFIKGYFRLATALKAKQKMAECIVTLDRGLDIDPTNANLKKMRKEVGKCQYADR